MTRTRCLQLTANLSSKRQNQNHERAHALCSRFAQNGKFIIMMSLDAINQRKRKTFLQSAKVVLATFWCGFIAAHKTWKYYEMQLLEEI